MKRLIFFFFAIATTYSFASTDSLSFASSTPSNPDTTAEIAGRCGSWFVDCDCPGGCSSGLFWCDCIANQTNPGGEEPVYEDIKIDRINEFVQHYKSTNFKSVGARQLYAFLSIPHVETEEEAKNYIHILKQLDEKVSKLSTGEKDQLNVWLTQRGAKRIRD